MKRYVLVLCAVLLAVPLSAENKFVGVNSCVCHTMDKLGKQVGLWKATKHAEAYAVLKSAKAAEFAKAKNIKGNAVDAKECLECHTTGFGKEAEKSFKMDMGVQCESCHGAASAYKVIHSKPENKTKAIAAGLKLGKDDEALCKTCHVAKMHPVKAFDYKKFWGEIKHPRPKA